MGSLNFVGLLSCILISSPLSNAQFCYNTGNFTSNSTYGKNRNLILSSLPSNVKDNRGFYISNIGQDSNSVYAMGFCRGDLSDTSCFNCINSTTHAIIKNCTNQKEAIDWGNPAQCIVRCSDKSLLGVMDTWPAIVVYFVENITSNFNAFDQALNSLVDSLIFRAATASSSLRLKLATGKRSYTEFDYIYGLMQCTPDISPSDCSDCLRQAVDYYQSFKRKRAVNVLGPSCIFQYDLSPFYESSVADFDVSSPPPPPPTVSFAPPGPPPSTSMTMKEDNSNGISQAAIIIAVPAICLLILITLGCVFFRLWKSEVVKKKNSAWITAVAKLFTGSRQGRMEHYEEEASQSVDSLRFDFATIRAATNEFSNKLGEGGFGLVYKGKLSNGQEIAVKRLSGCSEHGEVQFKNEIVTMASLEHKNLVRLLGFCLEGKERILIYEFVPNASLDRFIFDSNKRLLLNWETRYKIIVGIARGLLYLHEESQLRIIHHDLKAGNVLLDDKMNPKIADFGLARLAIIDQSQGNTKKIVGTYGYMPPEYTKYGQFSMKTDVFSFGVLILEIVSGRKNGDAGSAELLEHLISYVWKKWKEDKALSLIDQTIKDGSKSDKMRCIHIGLLCVQENVAKRPTMTSVVLMLSSCSMNLPLPSKPAFLLPNSIVSGQTSEHLHNVSINVVSISEPYPR